MIPEHVETYHGGAVCVEEVEGKGRVLVAACDFEPGERILLEYPLVEAVVDPLAPVYKRLLELSDKGTLRFAPLFYWCALCTLTSSEVASADCQAWPAVSEQTQEHALELFAPPEDCEGASESVSALVASLWPRGSAEGPDPARLERLLQSWIYNSFDQGTDGNAEAGAMYLAASMLSHSCCPNAAWHMDEADSFILHARRLIKEGEEITISYLSPADLCLPTADRRELLHSSKAFWCLCERCADPLDSTRAFRCPRCTRGRALASSSAASSAEGASAAAGKEGRCLVCSECGELSAEEAAPLLAAEASLRQLALEQAAREGATRKGAEEQGATGELEPVDVNSKVAEGEGVLERLRRAEAGGLHDQHWIIDALRQAAAVECPALTCVLLRSRIKAHKEGAAGAYAATKQARLHLALGEALRTEGGIAALEEAVEAYDVAASCFAVLFGDDHPEHREAATLRDLTSKKLSQRRALESGKQSGGSRGGDLPAPVGGKRAGQARKNRR